MGILEALAYAHEQGYVHRDLKPANVMIGPFGEVLVMDWGIARPVAGGGPTVAEALGADDDGDGDAGGGDSGRVFSTHVGTVVGTPAYMSPEQASGEAVDARSDVFSVCVLAYELLTLRHPWAGRRNVQEVLAAVVGDKPRAVRCGWWCGPWPAEPARR